MKKYKQIDESNINRLQEDILSLEDEKEKMNDPMYDGETPSNTTFDYPESGELLQPVEETTENYINVLCGDIINNINCLCEICSNDGERSFNEEDLIYMLIGINRELEFIINNVEEQQTNDVEYLDEPVETIVV